MYKYISKYKYNLYMYISIYILLFSWFKQPAKKYI